MGCTRQQNGELIRRSRLKPGRQLRRVTLVACALVAVTAIEPPPARAEEQFGAEHFPVSCIAGFQKKIDLALAMLQAVSFPDSADPFTDVSREDPKCAMEYCGLAAAAIGSLYG